MTRVAEPEGARQPPVDYIERTLAMYADLGYPAYRWVYSDEPLPWTPARKPLAESRIALVASGGIYREGQIAFHYKDDLSYRKISTSTPTSELRATHFAYDLTDARRDPNVVFPLDVLRGLVAEGVVGGLAQNAYTFMGGIYSVRKMRDRLGPAICEGVLSEGVDLALLVPV